MWRADLDGGNVVRLVDGLSAGDSIAIDHSRAKLYWTDSGTSTVSRADLDGGNVEEVDSDTQGAEGITFGP